MHMKIGFIQVSLLALIAMLGFANVNRAATTLGSIGDDMPSVAYFQTAGEMIIQPDGVPIGSFYIQSASGIFVASSNFPPHGLGANIDTASEKAWTTLSVNAFTEDFSLGAIAPPGLPLAHVLEDFSIVGSSGFGTGTLIFDLVYVIPEPATCTLCGLLMLGLFVRRHRRD
jgi:hypothetical protein